MNENELNGTSSDKDKKDYRLLLGTLFAITLVFMYSNVFGLSAQLAWHYFEKGYLTFVLRNFPPILIVMVVGFLLKRKMDRTQDARMVKILVAWLGSIFIFYIVYTFYLSKMIMIFKRDMSYKFYFVLSEPEWLIKYVEPLMYPSVLAIIIYLVILNVKKPTTTEL